MSMYISWIRWSFWFTIKSYYSDLLDYVKGVEVGLDSNARKNRTSKAMENIVESFIVDAGFIKMLIILKNENIKYEIDLE